MTFVDAGFLVGLATPSDELHARAHAWLRAMHGERVLLTDYVLIETYNLLSHPSERLRGDRLLSAYIDRAGCELIVVQPPLLTQGLKLFRSRGDKHWSLTDCVSFVLMTQHGVTAALTHDHHFAQAGFEPLLRREP